MNKFWKRGKRGNIIVFSVACAAVLLGIGMAAIYFGMFLGGSGQLAAATDAGALNVAKHSVNFETILAQGDEELYRDLADKNSEGITLVEVNRVLSKALLIQMNQTAMQNKGFGTPESEAHANAYVEAANAVAGKLAEKMKDPSRVDHYFTEVANGNSVALLGKSAKVEFDGKNGWGTSFVDRGEESNISFEPGQLPEGFNAEEVGIKAADGKFYFKGYTPIKVGKRQMYLVPFKVGGQPHLISAKTFDANSQKSNPFPGWEKPVPNAIAMQGKTVTEGKQVLQARSFVQINPAQTFPVTPGDVVVKIAFEENVAHWYVNGAKAQPQNKHDLLAGMFNKLMDLAQKSAQNLGDLQQKIQQIQQVASEAGVPTSNNAAAPSSPNSPNPPSGAYPGGGIAGGVPLSKLITDNGAGLQQVAKLITDNGAGLTSANGLISDRGHGIVTDNGAGLISNKGGGIVTDNGAGLISNRAGGIVTDNGAGLVGGGAGLISVNHPRLITDNGAGLTNGGRLITDNGAGLISLTKLITDNGAGLTGGRRTLMGVGESSGPAGAVQALLDRMSLAAKAIMEQQHDIQDMLAKVREEDQKAGNQDNGGSDTKYSIVPETQSRTFPLGLGSLNVVAYLGNEYTQPANLYEGICALGGDYKEVIKVLLQRAREIKGDYTEEELVRVLKAALMSASNRDYYLVASEKNGIAILSGSSTWNSAFREIHADGMEKEIAGDSKEEKPNWCIATATGLGAKALPSKCVTKGKFFWKPGTGFGRCLGELRVQRETDIYANGMSSIF